MIIKKIKKEIKYLLDEIEDLKKQLKDKSK